MDQRYFRAGIFLCTFVMVVRPGDLYDGRIEGVQSARLPSMSDGSIADQNWFCMGQDPAGNVYIGGMDHANNAGLYEYVVSTGTLRLVGDALAAARAAGNLQDGEKFEKFHTHPAYVDGRLYLASNCNSDYMGDTYKSKPGFHWFAYDIADDEFIDLSANDPGRGSIGGQQGIAGCLADEERNCVYALGLPLGHLFRYDIATGTTTSLGRPSKLTDKYAGPGVYPWLDDQGRVCCTFSGNYNTAAYDHVYYWDPATGQWGEHRDWKIRGSRTGQIFGAMRLNHGGWSPDGNRLYLTNYEGEVHRFDKQHTAWQYVGRMRFGSPYENATFATHTMFVSPDEKSIYMVNSHWDNTLPGYYLVEMGIATGACRNVLKLADADPALTSDRPVYHAGENNWDSEGYLYFSSFSMRDGQGTLFTRLNPYTIQGLPVLDIFATATVVVRSMHSAPRRPQAVVMTILGGGARANALRGDARLYDPSGRTVSTRSASMLLVNRRYQPEEQ